MFRAAAIGATLLTLTFDLGAVAPEQTRVRALDQNASSSGPQIPFDDFRPCPVQGCTLGKWIAEVPVTLRTQRRDNAPVAFTLNKGALAVGLTRVYVTLKLGRVEFGKAVDLITELGPLHVEPGDTLYLLTYLGEGETAAWFNGRFYKDLDGSEFFNALCQYGRKCNGKIIERAQTVQWIQLRNAQGVTGWTNEPNKFTVQ